jgi:hypothetical protein
MQLIWFGLSFAQGGAPLREPTRSPFETQSKQERTRKKKRRLAAVGMTRSQEFARRYGVAKWLNLNPAIWEAIAGTGGRCVALGRVESKPAPFQKSKGCGTQRPTSCHHCNKMICVRATTKRLANASNRHQHEASQNQECRFAANAAQLERG